MELNLIEPPSHVLEDSTGDVLIVINCQVSKKTKHVHLNRYLFGEWREDKNMHKQGEILNIESEYNTSDVKNKNFDARALKCRTDELDEDTQVLRESMCDKNRTLGQEISGGIPDSAICCAEMSAHD